ncbi:competence type IV pilus minor pilin ComGG [Bacillus sp. FJAT-27445]|uniref:competence type IV pilus minor pilin ComGG n=1 Tax=Bacillus sp. FJAT-27445 TaxID=1679166 RepID=UPI00074336A9|nr:competence type IV pilus minor pilin ComGG [Bacillus sp. FJAT-27445]
MANDENGFTYPITLSILLSISICLAATSELLLIERRMAKEAEIIQLQDYYLLRTLKKVETILKEKGGTPAAGSFTYRKGTASYTVVSSAPGMLYVTLLAKVEGRSSVIGYGYYDITLKKMVKWGEKN